MYIGMVVNALWERFSRKDSKTTSTSASRIYLCWYFEIKLMNMTRIFLVLMLIGAITIWVYYSVVTYFHQVRSKLFSSWFHRLNAPKAHSKFPTVETRTFASGTIFNSFHSYRRPKTIDLYAVNAIKPLFEILEDQTFNVSVLNKTLVQDWDIGEKMILLYFSLSKFKFSSHSKWDGKLFFPENKNFACPKKCIITDSKKYIHSADAIIFQYFYTFHAIRNNRQSFMKPFRNRTRNQIWIMFTMESPLCESGLGLEELDTMINMTLTYRLDSDIYRPYGYFYKLNRPRTPIEAIATQAPHVLRRKKKFAASLISNCRSKSGREKLIAEMKKYISIDSYGYCGNKKCPAKECGEYLGRNYKFYLAFENSLCQDYITEKFFRAFQHGMVPVVLGLGDYSKVAPPNSYINALDFPNVKALTDYLTFLDKNDEEYLKYFEWQSEYGVFPLTNVYITLCRVCMKVWETSSRSETHQLNSFHKFRNHKVPLKFNSRCRNDTLAYWLLQNATSACVRFSEVRKQKYFEK